MVEIDWLIDWLTDWLTVGLIDWCDYGAELWGNVQVYSADYACKGKQVYLCYICFLFQMINIIFFPHRFNIHDK